MNQRGWKVESGRLSEREEIRVRGMIAWGGWIVFLGMNLGLGIPLDGEEKGQELPKAAEQEVDFKQDVLPILKGRCFECHGGQKQEGGLRLDQEKGAHTGGDGGAAFEPGKSEDSTLIEYVAGIDPDRRMPPEGEPLTAKEVGVLRRWIDDGGKYPEGFSKGNSGGEHWAFGKVKRPTPPENILPEWCRNPIDQFIIAKLEKEGVSPSPEAGRVTLARRLYLDLIGLPPSAEQVDAFVNDSRENAYELLVEELLSSPHFGERWGRHWLDLARYADSDGYEKDRVRPHAWRYRDWVIDSINRDQPFDEFTIEQLAGDLLPNATLEQKIATGFHRNTLTNTEGGVDQEEYRVAATVDRVNTLGGAWMGLTLGCAQCHTHKYDPITQREYYQLFAYFNSIDEVNIPAPTNEESTKYAETQPIFEAKKKELEESLKKYDTEVLPGLQAGWEGTALEGIPLWNVEIPISVSSANGAIFSMKPDGSVLADGTEPETDEYTVIMESGLKKVTGVRVEVLPDESLYRSTSARGESQEFVLSEVSVSVASDERKERKEGLKPVAIKRATADFASGSKEKNDLKSADLAIDGKVETGWSTAGGNTKPHSLVLEFVEGVEFPDGTWVVLKLNQQGGGKKTLGRFRVSLTGTAGPIEYREIPDEAAWGLTVAESQRSSGQKRAITEYYRTIETGYVGVKKELDAHLKTEPVLTTIQAQVVVEKSEPRKTHVLTRGDFLRPAAEVSGGVPDALGLEMGNEGPQGRLAVAKWLVHPDHPLTARVTVNRWWKDLFGQPLVTTIEDFGTRGEQPTHPELLNWLASELIQRKWSRKEMVRLIVQSAAYRQDSRTRPELMERDAKNRWVARQNRYRMEAENVRDLYLSASGLLNPRVGGASIRPPLPSGIAELGYAGGHQWPVTEGAEKYRRGMYIFLQRTVPYPMLTTFDAPDSTTSCLRRERSNTPLQALTLLNDPVFVECAQSLGIRGCEKFPEETTKRLEWMFQSCVSRKPTPEELERLTALYGELKELVARTPESAGEIVGEQKPKEGEGAKVAVEDQAASVAAARIILNLEEFMVRE